MIKQVARSCAISCAKSVAVGTGVNVLLPVLNQICIDLGGVEQATKLAALNEICQLQGGTGTNLTSLDAVNELCTLNSAQTTLVEFTSLQNLYTALGGVGSFTNQYGYWNAIQQGGLLNVFDSLAPSGLVLTVLNDTSIKLDFTVNSTNADGHKIERSTDGVTYAEIGSVLGATATYTDATGVDGTRYYYRVRAYKNTTYSAYCTAANDWTAIKMVLTSTGTGAGVSTVRFLFDTTNVAVTLDGNGKWYSDAAGTLDESASYTFVAGSIQTRYLKVTSGVSNMLIFAKGNWMGWGTDLSEGFASSDNAASIAKDISALTSLTSLRVGGSNTLSGDIANLTSLTSLRVGGSNTLSGDIANLTSLTSLRVTGSNTLSGDIKSMVTGITTFILTGLNQMDTYTSGAIWSLTDTSIINPAVGYGYSSTEIDNMLIDMAASLGTVVDKIITLQGSSQPRTAASDAAVTTLNGKGWTVVTN